MIERNIENILWSYSRLTTAKQCLKAYYYDKIRKPKPKIHLTPDIVAGSVLHERIEGLYHPRDVFKELKSGPKLIKKKGTPKKESAEDFADASQGLWFRYTQWHDEGLFGRRPIRWKSKQERFVWGHIIHELAYTIYENYSQQEPPLFTEFKLPVLWIDGLRMHGIADEIRYPLTIRDHKSRKQRISDLDLKYDMQFTMYAAILSIKCSESEKFARYIGATDEHIAGLQEDPLYLMDKFNCEHHWLQTGWVQKGEKRKVEVITAPPRTRQHLDEIIETMHELDGKIKDVDFKAERGRHCNWCFFQEVCDSERDNNIVPNVPYQHRLFDPAPPPQRRKAGHRQYRLFPPQRRKVS